VENVLHRNKRSLSVSSILVQVAEEIGAKARFQKDFLNQLVKHYIQMPCFIHARTYTHTWAYISYDFWPAVGSYCQDILILLEELLLYLIKFRIEHDK
jgi:hypothetical protein